MLASPSLDVPRRALRTSPDESRKLAAAVVQQVLQGAVAAEREFLTHCRACGDTLAFMLARRRLLGQGWVETPAWQAASEYLQEEGRTK